ncbi:hypothetical protein ACGFMK_20430 [Amycolatopsis sp. NPDC049252]|uniref:hypothetical protein n=1 Tax=Amycolatopsis sp. NPDC049252 TaxID=3363933 RepID=UPI00371BB2DC
MNRLVSRLLSRGVTRGGFVALLLLGISVVVAAVLLLAGGAGRWIPPVASEGVKPDFGHLVVVAATSGLVACAVLEFVKKLSALSARFNRSRVNLWFDGESVDLGVGVPMIISYRGSIRQVASQVAQSLREQVRVLLQDDSRHDARDRLTGKRVGLFWSVVIREVERTSEGGVEPSAIFEYIERQVDAFQIDATTRWYTLLRATSAVAAGVLSALGVWATGASFSGIAVGLVLGLVVGGPVSWTVRDLVRLVERGARR